MHDLLSYSINDFLMYSPEIYYRLLARYNAAIWPLQVVALVGCFLMIGLLCRPQKRSGLVIGFMAACAWLWIGLVYFPGYYGTISWVAPYFSGLFVFEALLIAVSVVRGSLCFACKLQGIRLVGLVLFAGILLLMPGLAIVEGGRGEELEEMVWLTPDATVLATCALFLAASRSRWFLFLAPAIWTVLQGALLWAMESPGWWLMPTITSVTIAGALYRRYSPHWARCSNL